MAKQATDFHTVSLVGAGGAGKTTLTEALLQKAGVLKRRGTIEEKNTVTDFEDDEKARGQSIQATPVHMPWDGKTVTLIDAPGALDFLGEAVASLAAVETAIVCVSAADGVNVATRRAFRAARDRGLACVVVITRVDAENVQSGELYAGIQKAIGERAVPLNLPNTFGGDVAAVHDIFGGNVPEHLEAQAADFRQQATDRVVECDDDLLERYFETGVCSPEELATSFPRALRQGNIVPILHASVDKDVGIKKLLDFITHDCPSAVRRAGEVVRPATKDGEPHLVQADGPFSAQVWKIQIDPHVGRLAYLRVWSGSLASKSQFVVARTGKTERIGDFMTIHGRDMSPVPRAQAGQIVAVAKIEDIQIGDTVSDGQGGWVFTPVKTPTPKVTMAITPKNRGDETKLGPELAKLADADPSFRAEREEATGEMVVRGLSTLHLDVLLGRLARKKVEVDTHAPRIPYLETVSGAGAAQFRHKKQSGGRGQFAEVHLRVKPLERGTGFQFVDQIVGGAIPRQYIPAVEKGISEQCAQGVIAGYPFVDVEVAAHDGKFHDVDSDEFSFKLAAAHAFRDAVANARPVLLEPVMDVEIEVPSRFMGDISGDLNSRRGRIQGMEQEEDIAVIKALVPLSEMMTYSTELRSLTAGEGDYSFELSHYDPVPSHLAADVIAKSKQEGAAV